MSAIREIYAYIKDDVRMLVEALCYKPEGHGFYFRCGNRIFFSIFLILPDALRPLGSAQRLREISTSNLSGDKAAGA
jgi:hypothetical protein